jgi:hypothetical protein
MSCFRFICCKNACSDQHPIHYGKPWVSNIGVYLLVIAGFLIPDAASGEFRAGVGQRIITPNPLLPVSGGMGPTSPATEKRGELMVQALVIENDGTRVALVAIDLLGFPSVLVDRIAKLVPEIPAGQLIVGASHTHSGPDCYAFPDGKGGSTADLDYLQNICELASEAIHEAVQNMQGASLRIASGEAVGKIAYNYYAPDLYDRRVAVIQAISLDDKVLATLVNYAIHPEVLGAGVGILSPDLIGPLRERIESNVGGMALFFNSAQGGMVTADNRDLDDPSDAKRGYWNDTRAWEECVRIGNTLGDEALRVVSDAAIQVNPKVRCLTRMVKFPVESDQLWSVVTLSPLQYPHNGDRSITARINLLELGDSQVLTIPGEALPNIGFYLKRKMNGKCNLLFGLTNDAFGYILTKVDYHSFPRYDYVSRVSLGEMTGEILIENAIEMIAEMAE